MKTKTLTIIYCLALTLLSACSNTTTEPETIVITATDDPAQLTAEFIILQEQARQTVDAEQAQQEAEAQANAEETAAEQPAETITSTATITNTVTQESQPTMTYTVQVQPSATSTTEGNPYYNCSLTASLPAYNRYYTPGGDFDAWWEIKNTGEKSWGDSDIDFVYINGEKMHTGPDRIDLGKTVQPGESIEFLLDMLAPNQVGGYQEVWALQYGDLTFCVVTVTIQVQ